MPFRKVFFWLHLTAGVLAGVVILIMSVTGVLLMYEQQITNWADRRAVGQSIASGSGGEQWLPWEELLNRAAAEQDAQPTGVVLRRDSELPVMLAFGRDRVYVNPYTGAVLGPGSEGVRRFFRTMTDWHRWLGRQGESRAAGRAVTGACNLAFLFLVVSGFYIWWPRKWRWQNFRPVMWFRGGLRGKARDFNWHNTIGFWCAVPLFLVVLSGVVMSYGWANNLIYRITGDPVPVRAAGPGQREREGASARRGQAAATTSDSGTSSGADLSGLWTRAQSDYPNWRTMTLTLPQAGQRTASLSVEEGGRGRVDLRTQLELDRATGEVVRREGFDSLTMGRRIRSWLRFLHTGEAAGIVGQTVAGIASAGAAVLVWTGIMLALRRLRNWNARRRIHEDTRESVLVGD